MIIRTKSFKGWMKANFDKSQLKDIANHGADAGWDGLTYYTDTCKLYNKFKDEIWESLIEDVESMGYKNVYEMIASFSQPDVGNCDQHENLLTWYMAEKIARELTEVE